MGLVPSILFTPTLSTATLHVVFLQSYCVTKLVIVILRTIKDRNLLEKIVWLYGRITNESSTTHLPELDKRLIRIIRLPEGISDCNRK